MKKQSTLLGLGLLAVGFVAIGIGSQQVNKHEASALTTPTAKYLTYGSTNDGTSVYEGSPNAFKVYLHSTSTLGSSELLQDAVTDWTYYYITAEVVEITEHTSFRLLKDGVEYYKAELSGTGTQTLYAESLADGNYELEYSCKQLVSMFTGYKYYTYTYRFEVDKSAPKATLRAGGDTVSSGSYTNKQIKYTATDANLSCVKYKAPSSSVYKTSYTSSYTVPTTGENGWWKFYATDTMSQTCGTVSIYLDTVLPVGKVTNANGATISNGGYTNCGVKYTATDTGSGVFVYQYKKPNASDWEFYTADTEVTEEGLHTWRCLDKAGNIAEEYKVTIDRQIPTAQLYVDEKPMDNNGYTNGGHIKFVCDANCFVKMPGKDTFERYYSGTEYYKPGKYVFYGETSAGNCTGYYTVVIDRTEKTVALQNVIDGCTDGEVLLDWTDGDTALYAPIKRVTVNGKAYTKGEKIYTIDEGRYEVNVIDEAGNTWETAFVSTKQNVLTKTLQKEYYEAHDKENNYFAFASYDKAYAFAVARENVFVATGEWKSESWDVGIAMDTKDSVNAKNGRYYIYKKSGNPQEQVAYFTKDRLDEVIAEYAGKDINKYYYWEKDPTLIAEGENLFSYSDNKRILASSVQLDGTGARYIDGEEYTETVYETNGTHTLVVADEWRNTSEYTLIVVRETPTVQYAVDEGEYNTVDFDRTYYIKGKVTVKIVDALDEMAMYSVYDENGALLGHFSKGEEYELNESGKYSVVAVNHAGKSKAFVLIISRNAPAVALTENTDTKRLEVVVEPSEDNESHIQTLEIYKSVDEGKTWTLLEKDDYGTPVSTKNLWYAFRRTGKYKVVLTDEFRTGIDAITAEVAYTQKTPEAVLTGVENGGVTHTSVTITWTDEGAATLTKDGEVVEYKSGQELNEDGTYKFTITNYDGDTTSYTFTIEKKGNGCAVTISIIGASVFVGIVLFVLIKRRKNF